MSEERDKAFGEFRESYPPEKPGMGTHQPWWNLERTQGAKAAWDHLEAELQRKDEHIRKALGILVSTKVPLEYCHAVLELEQALKES